MLIYSTLQLSKKGVNIKNMQVTENKPVSWWVGLHFGRDG